MVKKLVIHLGDSKTGSTSIQSTLANGRWESDAHTLFYPAKFNHSRLADTLYRKSSTKFRDTRFQSIARKLNRSDADIGVISAEQFEFCDPKLLGEAIEEYLPQYRNNVQLISYIRPHPARLLSSYAQQIKRGVFSGELEQFCHYFFNEKRRIHYAERCQSWKDVFGEAYIVRPLIPALLKGRDVVTDFLYLCFGDDQFSIGSSIHNNKSLGIEDLSVLRHIHSRLDTANGKYISNHRLFGAHFSELLMQLPTCKTTKLAFHRSLFEKIVEMTRVDIDETDKLHLQEFGSPFKTAMLDASNKLVDDQQSIDISDHFSQETIRIIDCWIELIKIMSDSDPQSFQKMIRRPTRE